MSCQMVCPGLKKISLTFPRQSKFGPKQLMWSHVHPIVHMKEFCITCSLGVAKLAMDLSLEKRCLSWWDNDKIVHGAMMLRDFLELWAPHGTAEGLLCRTACKAVVIV